MRLSMKHRREAGARARSGAKAAAAARRSGAKAAAAGQGRAPKGGETSVELGGAARKKAGTNVGQGKLAAAQVKPGVKRVQ